MGDRYLNRIKGISFKNQLTEGKTYFNVFGGTTSKRLNRYILPPLHEDQPDVVLLHIGYNDINN